MALTDNDGMVMPVAPAYGSGNGFGFGGDNGWWLILLFLFAFNGGWGGGFGGNAPYVANDVQRGFDQSALMTGIAGLNSTVANGFSTAEVGRVAANTDLLQTLWGIQSQQQNCCCENRAAIADLKYTIAQENCLDRQVINDGVRDIIASNTANTQAILDKLCDQEIDALKTQILNLQNQLNAANLAASQTAQTAQIIQALTPVV